MARTKWQFVLVLYLWIYKSFLHFSELFDLSEAVPFLSGIKSNIDVSIKCFYNYLGRVHTDTMDKVVL